MSNPQVSQQEIESWLCEVANILRGPVDPANLRDSVFPPLFLKWLSDSWDEEQENPVAKFNKDPEDGQLVYLAIAESVSEAQFVTKQKSARIQVEGEPYTTPSAAAYRVRSSAVNDWFYWKVKGKKRAFINPGKLRAHLPKAIGKVKR
jgi:hypothetical protein